MDERYSWVIHFERRDGKPEDELYFDTEDEAREVFEKYADDDSVELYDSIDLAKVDWYGRIEIPLDSLTF